MEKLLKLAAERADQAEVYHVRKTSSPMNFYNWRQADVLVRDLDEVSLRVIRNGKIGTVKGSATEDPHWMVDAAIQAAEFGAEAEFRFPGESSEGCGGAICDPELEHLDPAQMAADGRAIYDYVRSRYPELPLNLYLDNEITDVTLLNTSGKAESYRKTLYTVCLLSMYQRSKEGINKEITGCRYFRFPEPVIDELITENRLSENEIRVPTRKMPVLFRASSTWSILYRIMEGANGAQKVRGVTPLIDKLDQPIFGPEITLEDDPTRDWAPGSTPFDDEGTPTRKKLIVDRGVFKNFIFDLTNGSKDGSGSSGNGIKRSMWTRGIEVSPNPRFNNLVMIPGDKTLDELIRMIPEGIIVNDVIGFHSGNILQGHYSMNVGIGFYVKNGRIVGRAVDTMIAGNIYEDFHRILGMTRDLEYNPIAYSPDILIDAVSVTGTAI
ncbi:TldD/PmbA family protein [bacterium]|nr:TldD/PmbA family protein [candidate division CSSED10-310 bacterium]